jgi:hypothetical protein
VALAAGGLRGTYKTKLTGRQVGGTWTIKFARGTYHVKDNGRPIVHGVFTITGADVSFKDTGGRGKCSGTGKYSYKLRGKKLTFTKIKDSGKGCIGRVTVLTTKPLTKVG